MTRDQEIERVLDRWFTEGPTQMPSRFLDDTLDRIDRVPQQRLAGLRTRLPGMNPYRGFVAVATAAVVVTVAGFGAAVLTQPGGIAGTSPRGSALLPASVQAEWQSAGTRVVPGPGPGGVNSYALGVLIDPTSMDIQNAHTHVVNSARLVAPDRFEIRAITMGDFWPCAVGDVGRYTFSLTAGDQHLTLTPVSDACAGRATVLSGDWLRTENGDLDPGAHAAAIFRPFGGGSTAQMAFTVPAAWKAIGERDGSLILAAPVSDNADIRALSNVSASAATCNENRSADGVGRTSAAMAAWLKTVPGLVVSPPTTATIGGLSGVMVDLSVVPGWTPTCAPRGIYTFSFWGSDSGGWSDRLALNGSAMARYVLLDRGDGSTLVIAVEAPDKATWDAFIAEAMPIVQSFEFTR
jgi:hypothetical protein